MKPQELKLECELFNEFRRALDAAINNCVRQMVVKRLSDGTITGKIEIHLEEAADENGEVLFLPGQILVNSDEVYRKTVGGKLPFVEILEKIKLKINTAKAV